MHVLLLGATGNLGRRLIPALLSHGHRVTAYVRSPEKLRSMISPALFEKITLHEGDALVSSAVEDAIRRHGCDAVMQTSGTRISGGGEQELGKIATSVSSAAIRVGKDRGKPLRAWLIGGMGSLEYPNSGGWMIQDYLPAVTTLHHRETEQVVKAISTSELEWSLLCVAWMVPRSEVIEELSAPHRHGLVVTATSPPEWQDNWVRYLPLLGDYLNIFLNIKPYTTKLEDVADFLAEDFEKGGTSPFLGNLAGMKESGKPKTS